MISGKWRAVAEQGIGFAVHPIELGVRDPGILDELELTRDIGVEGNEIYSAWDPGIFASQHALPVTNGDAIRATAPNDPVKPA